MVRGERLGHPGGGCSNHHRSCRCHHHDDPSAVDAGHHPDHRGSATGIYGPGTDLSATHRPAHYHPSAHQSSDDGAAGDHHADDHGLPVLTL